MAEQGTVPVSCSDKILRGLERPSVLAPHNGRQADRHHRILGSCPTARGIDGNARKGNSSSPEGNEGHKSHRGAKPSEKRRRQGDHPRTQLASRQRRPLEDSVAYLEGPSNVLLPLRPAVNGGRHPGLRTMDVLDDVQKKVFHPGTPSRPGKIASSFLGVMTWPARCTHTSSRSVKTPLRISFFQMTDRSTRVRAVRTLPTARKHRWPAWGWCRRSYSGAALVEPGCFSGDLPPPFEPGSRQHEECGQEARHGHQSPRPRDPPPGSLISEVPVATGDQDEGKGARL